MFVTDYFHKLKTLVNALRDVEQPVSDKGQVPNMLRGLNPKFHTRTLIPNLTLFPTFLRACTLLRMDAAKMKNDASVTNATTLLATDNNTSARNSGGPSDGNFDDRTNNSGRNGRRWRDKKRNSGSGSSSSSDPYVTLLSWTWVMVVFQLVERPTPCLVSGVGGQWRAPPGGNDGNDILGPHLAQAYNVSTHVSPYMSSSSAPSTLPAMLDWDQAGLVAAMNALALAPSTFAWVMDSNATLHMSSDGGNLQKPSPSSFSSHVMVDNGSSMPITSIGSISFSTLPLFFIHTNVLVVPHLVKNLISVHQFT